MKKTLGFLSLLIASIVLSGSAVFAHVVVKPSDAQTGVYQSFIAGVPNEREVAVVKLKLIIPDNVASVTPNVKPGWKVDLEKSGSGETAVVKSVTWSGGTIAPGFRDEFVFTAKTSDQAGDVIWKAYQTYADGVTVSWDQPADSASDKDDESATSGPYSVTKLTATPTASQDTQSENNNDTLARSISFVALAIAVIAFATATRKKA